MTNHHLQQSFLELNLTASQVRASPVIYTSMGLDPILDSLNLEDGQLIIAEEGIEGVLQGMETPMSDIPVLVPLSVYCRCNRT